MFIVDFKNSFSAGGYIAKELVYRCRQTLNLAWCRRIRKCQWTHDALNSNWAVEVIIDTFFAIFDLQVECPLRAGDTGETSVSDNGQVVATKKAVILLLCLEYASQLVYMKSAESKPNIHWGMLLVHFIHIRATFSRRKSSVYARGSEFYMENMKIWDILRWISDCLILLSNQNRQSYFENSTKID